MAAETCRNHADRSSRGNDATANSLREVDEAAVRPARPVIVPSPSWAACFSVRRPISRVRELPHRDSLPCVPAARF
jgi:hypothetical protein